MKKTKREKTYAFIDSQNLNLGASKDIYRKKKLVYKGWRLDFKKFRQYLWDKFRVNKAYLFIGYVKENERLYKSLKAYGYELVFKPTINDHTGKPKGNVDAELVLYSAAIEYTNYDQAVIVSGDGDFQCLLKFLKERKRLKAVVIPNRYTESSLLKDYQAFKHFLNREKEKLEFRP